MSFELPKLPFSPNALEPVISERTIDYHYNKHHKKYYENLNKLIENTRYARMDLPQIIVESNSVDKEIFNNAAQASNHDFFWKCLSGGQLKPSGVIVESFEKQFGSLESFTEQFSTQAEKVFGSGWVWLVRNPDLSLSIISLPDAGTPLTEGQKPILCLDVWEHAYYLDYQNDRPTFIKNFWKIINWNFVESNLSSEDRVTSGSAKHSISENLYH